MPEGCYCQGGEGDCTYSWLDELMCEYVDGTMDPAVRESFEEVLAGDPRLARQVERLRRTRSLLCEHGWHIQAPRGLQARVRQRLACEMMRPQQPAWSVAVSRLGRAAVWASVMGVMLLVGLLVGATLSADESPAVAAETTAAPAARRPASALPRAAMTPRLHRSSLRRVPLFVRRPARALLPPVRTGYLLPDVLDARPTASVEWRVSSGE